MEGERARGSCNGTFRGIAGMEGYRWKFLREFEGRMLANVPTVSKGFQIWVKHSFCPLFSLPSILLQRIDQFSRLYSPHAPCPTIRFRSRRYILPHPRPEKIFDRIPVYLLLLFLLEDERQFPPLKTLKAYVDSDALARVVEREEKREEKREESVVGRTGLAGEVTWPSSRRGRRRAVAPFVGRRHIVSSGHKLSRGSPRD